MARLLPSRMLRFLQAAACLVVVAWGVVQASQLVSTLLLALLLAYCVLPLPQWIMRRFKLGEGAAIGLTVTLVGLFYLIVGVYLVDAAHRMTAKLPGYEDRLQAIYDGIVPFLVAHGIQSSSLSTATLLSSDRMLGYARAVLPGILGSVSNGVLISLLSLLFVVEMSVEPAKQSRLVAGLISYGRDVQYFIAVSAKTGALTALANLVLLVVLGVDFPVLWCVLYFFLQFIPNLGSILALVPPTLLALVTLGWERALVVAVGMLLTNLITANVLNPIFLKKGVDISFLEIILSLIVWGSLLGSTGSLVAIPLTIVLKKYFENSSVETETLVAG